MKKLLIVAICAVGILSGQAQGLINFVNLSGPVSNNDTGDLLGPEAVGQIWAGADAGSLAPVGDPLAFAGGGIIVGPEVAIPGVAGGATAFVQLRAWDATFASFAEAQAGLGANGFSDVVESPALKTPGALLPAPNLNTTAFGITAIPEPSTIALAILGAAALFIRRRK